MEVLILASSRNVLEDVNILARGAELSKMISTEVNIVEQVGVDQQGVGRHNCVSGTLLHTGLDIGVRGDGSIRNNRDVHVSLNLADGGPISMRRLETFLISCTTMDSENLATISLELGCEGNCLLERNFALRMWVEAYLACNGHSEVLMHGINDGASKSFIIRQEGAVATSTSASLRAAHVQINTITFVLDILGRSDNSIGISSAELDDQGTVLRRYSVRLITVLFRSGKYRPVANVDSI